MIKPQHSLNLYQKGINFSNYISYVNAPNIYSNNIYYQYQYLDNGPITRNYKVDSYYSDYSNFNQSKEFYDNLDNINFKYKNKINKRTNNIFSDNITKISTIMNYSYKYNTSTFNKINSNNIRINHNGSIIKIDNISNLNTILNKNYNRYTYNFNVNKVFKDYHNNTYYNIKSNNNYSRNDYSIKYVPNNISFISNNYNYNINNYYNKRSNNIKYKENSEVKHIFNKYSNVNHLKQQNLLSNFNNQYKFHEKYNLFYLKNKENKLKLKTIDDNLPKSFYEKINPNKNKNFLTKNIVIYKTSTKINNEIKNKNINDIKLKKANIKPMFIHKYRTNNNKENNIIINKYNIYNINVLPTNNFIKKQIIATKYPNNDKTSNKNNKIIVKSLQNCHTDENLISKSEIKKVLVNNNKININNLNININKIIKKSSLAINNKSNINYNKKNRILIISKKSPLKRKLIVNRKHSSAFLLSKVSKKCEICNQLIDSHLFKIHYNSHPSQILNWLYLGTFINACDIDELKRNNITYILNCANECNNTKLPESKKQLHLKINDSEKFKIIDYFEKANNFIHKCKKEGSNILVHCKFGISRSPSFIIAYLIKYCKLTVDKALKFVNLKRLQIKPNKGFMEQLYLYEKYIQEKKKKIVL